MAQLNASGGCYRAQRLNKKTSKHFFRHITTRSILDYILKMRQGIYMNIELTFKTSQYDNMIKMCQEKNQQNKKNYMFLIRLMIFFECANIMFYEKIAAD